MVICSGLTKDAENNRDKVSIKRNFLYLCFKIKHQQCMDKQIRVVMLETARDFMRELDDPVKKQFSKYINRIRTGYQGEYFKKLEGSDGLWEFKAK